MKRSKFNVSKDVSKRTYEGVVYDSELEMKFYKEYVLPRLKSGEIIDCKTQIPYLLLPAYKHTKFTGEVIAVNKINYVADFVITWANGHEQVIDTKGFPDNAALLKRKIFWAKYPDVDYIWMSYSKIDGGWIDYDSLKKNRAARKKLKNKGAKQ